MYQFFFVKHSIHIFSLPQHSVAYFLVFTHRTVIKNLTTSKIKNLITTFRFAKHLLTSCDGFAHSLLFHTLAHSLHFLIVFTLTFVILLMFRRLIPFFSNLNTSLYSSRIASSLLRYPSLRPTLPPLARKLA